MTAMAHEPLTQEEVLLEGFLALDTPEGFRSELIEGDIVVTPPPDGEHDPCKTAVRSGSADGLSARSPCDAIGSTAAA